MDTTSLVVDIPDSPVLQELHFDVSPETLKLTNLGDLSLGTVVNLERAMMAASRYGGHYVSGHIDTMAYVYSIRPIGDILKWNLQDLMHRPCFI